MNDMEKQMRLEIQKVLMERELDLEQFERLEQMLHGAKAFLIGMSPKEIRIGGLARPDGQELADVIQAERYKALGFTPEQLQRYKALGFTEQLQRPNPIRERTFQRETAGLIRAAAAFGVTDPEDSDEDPEFDEVPVRVVDPLRDREVWLPISFVDKLIVVLADSDGDVADHLIDTVNDCRLKHTEVQPDAILPIPIELVYLISAGLTDPKIRELHPTAVSLCEELAAFVRQVAEIPDAQPSQPNKEISNGA